MLFYKCWKNHLFRVQNIGHILTTPWCKSVCAIPNTVSPTMIGPARCCCPKRILIKTHVAKKKCVCLLHHTVVSKMPLKFVHIAMSATPPTTILPVCAFTNRDATYAATNRTQMHTVKYKKNRSLSEYPLDSKRPPMFEYSITAQNTAHSKERRKKENRGAKKYEQFICHSLEVPKPT